MNNYGFYTPPQMQRITVSEDAYSAAQSFDIAPGDVLETDQGVIFEVERASGYVISGHTAKLALVGVDLRTNAATIIARAQWHFQDALPL